MPKVYTLTENQMKGLVEKIGIGGVKELFPSYELPKSHHLNFEGKIFEKLDNGRKRELIHANYENEPLGLHLESNYRWRVAESALGLGQVLIAERKE